MDSYVEIRQIVNMLLKRWWILVLGSLLTAAIGYGFSLSQTPVYEATATVMVGDITQAPQINRDDIAARDAFAQAYAEIARRQPVLDAVVKALELDISWRQLQDRVQIDVVVNTQLIEIGARAGSQQDAELIAGEIANQLILLSPTQQGEDSTRQFVQKEIEDLQIRIESGREKLAALQTEATSDIPADRLSELQTEIDTLERLITDWEDTYSRLISLMNPNVSQNSLTIIEEARSGSEPISPRTSLNIVLGASVGFVLAFGIVFLIAQFDNRVKSAEALERKLGLSHLGSIGKMKGKNFDGKLIAAHDPSSNETEAYRTIRRNIEFISRDRPTKSLLVTSPGVGDGKSVTVSNLGIIMAQAGFKTVIVDADLRTSAQHLIFDMPNGNGLSDLLTRPDLKPKDQLVNTTIANLQLLTSGNLSQSAIELSHPRKMKQILSDLTKHAEVVIVDVPSMANAEGAILASLADGVILVIDFDQTTQVSVEQSVAKLNLAGGRLLGGILNRFVP